MFLHLVLNLPTVIRKRSHKAFPEEFHISSHHMDHILPPSSLAWGHPVNLDKFVADCCLCVVRPSFGVVLTFKAFPQSLHVPKNLNTLLSWIFHCNQTWVHFVSILSVDHHLMAGTEKRANCANKLVLIFGASANFQRYLAINRCLILVYMASLVVLLN